MSADNYDALKEGLWEHLRWKRPILSFLKERKILPDTKSSFLVFRILTREKTDLVTQADRSAAASQVLLNGFITPSKFDRAEAKVVKGQLRYSSSTIRNIAIKACDESAALCVLMINMGFTPKGVQHDGKEINLTDTIFWIYEVSSSQQKERLKKILEAMISHHPDITPKVERDYTTYSEIRRNCLAKAAATNNISTTNPPRVRL